MGSKQITKIGLITKNIFKKLGINIATDMPIYLGDNNINHMKARHPNNYNKYGTYICDIIANPDYVGKNPKDNSIEFVKEFKLDNEFVKVAIRISTKKLFFVRSMYILNNARVENFISKGTLKKV